MPIRRAVNSKKEIPPKNRPVEAEPEPQEKKKDEVSSEESASTGEEQETETPPATSSEAEQPKEPEPEAGEENEEGKPSTETKKDDKDLSEKKDKKVKKTIPIWATLSANQLARAQKVTHIASSSRPKMDAILTEAIKACFHKGGASVVSIRKYIIKKYPSLDLERRGYLLKQSLKRELQRGMIRQVKGKGASGSFVAVPNAGKSAPKSKGGKKKSSSSAAAASENVKLEDILPLAFTRICEPKEASYGLIKKYVSQYYPKLNVDVRPQMLKNALQRAVDKGQLEQITGKGASGTFQLKRSGDKPLLGGSMIEDALLSAITAMNEPKTCSTTAIKKYILEHHPGTNSSFQVHLLKRTLQKCDKYGWMEQISGKGFSGTYRLCFPYYPNPDVLFPDKRREEEESSSEEEDSDEESEEEESSSEEESEEDEPPPKKRMQKKSASKGRAAPPPRQVTKPKPKRGPPKARGNIKSTPKRVPPPPSKKTKPAPPPEKKNKEPTTPAKKAKPAPPPAKKPAGSSLKKSASVEVKPSPKGKSTNRKSLRGK